MSTSHWTERSKGSGRGHARGKRPSEAISSLQNQMFSLTTEIVEPIKPTYPISYLSYSEQVEGQAL
ncbi:hypothetical protein A1A1_11707 [Planococcus antarcticus DSM 14505]|uniref:Uncharacterized protein n=1 Tax=Planococcus antarcticus DSM 14505 TaxID=1185653 RepID=A0AA87IJW8_9BACL|nr:hypothetical protein [Planococcus antarcticus]EIM06230.1 hypothetical protein A1A1_11707 [Planococcus antarcticus DSM 14505]